MLSLNMIRQPIYKKTPAGQPVVISDGQVIAFLSTCVLRISLLHNIVHNINVPGLLEDGRRVYSSQTNPAVEFFLSYLHLSKNPEQTRTVWRWLTEIVQDGDKSLEWGKVLDLVSAEKVSALWDPEMLAAVRKHVRSASSWSDRRKFVQMLPLGKGQWNRETVDVVLDRALKDSDNDVQYAAQESLVAWLGAASESSCPEQRELFR